MYAPTSQQVAMPLPFLARFEKYRISVGDLLSETLLAPQRVDKELHSNIDRAFLLRAVQAGCEHFVAWMDPARYVGWLHAVCFCSFVRITSLLW